MRLKKGVLHETKRKTQVSYQYRQVQAISIDPSRNASLFWSSLVTTAAAAAAAVVSSKLFVSLAWNTRASDAPLTPPGRDLLWCMRLFLIYSSLFFFRPCIFIGPASRQLRNYRLRISALSLARHPSRDAAAHAFCYSLPLFASQRLVSPHVCSYIVVALLQPEISRGVVQPAACRLTP